MTVSTFIRPHLDALRSTYDIDIIANFADVDTSVPGTREHFSIPIERRVAPLADFRAFWLIYQVLRRERYSIVHSVTPKAGLLSMLAATAARNPNRIHWFTGQVWVTRRGLGRTLLKLADRLIARAATTLLADSPTQRDFLIDEGVAGARKIRVLGAGSICGVDPVRFRPSEKARSAIRSEFGIPEHAVVILFLGRMTRDKGVFDLVDAFTRLPIDQDVRLLIVGPDEEGLGPHLVAKAGSAMERIIVTGPTDVPERFMAAADIFCMPSYREGFGMSVIEAASCGIPAVASEIYGLTDAVAVDETGLLFPVGDVSALTKSLALMVHSPELRARLGDAARERAVTVFSQSTITDELKKFYASLLA